MVEQAQSDKKHVIQILVDQTSPEAFFGWIDKGVAPNIQQYILGNKQKDGTYAKATISRNIVTGYPSTSANSHTSIITGSYARKNDLLYTTYWDLTGKRPKYTDVERMALSALKEMNTKHMNPHCKTFFEHVEDSASFHAIYRGASFRLFTTKTIIFKFLPLLLKLKRKSKNHDLDPLEMPEFWKIIIDAYVVKFLERIHETGKMPDACFIVFLLSDALGHKFGFNSEQYEEAIAFLDYMIGTIIHGLPDKKGNHVAGLKETGLLDNIIWNFCTDHAGRRVYPDKFIFINSIAVKHVPLRLIEGETPDADKMLKKMKKDYTKLDGFSIVGGELWHCWLRGKNGGTIDQFRKFHGEEQFRNYIPSKMKRNGEPSSQIDLIQWFVDKEYVQLVIIPEEKEALVNLSIDPAKRITMAAPREYDIKLFSKTGASKITRQIKQGKAHYAYEIISGKDPLNYQEIPGIDGKVLSNKEWLELTLDHQLPDVFHRLYGFFDCIHAPNFVITSALEYHFLSVYKVMSKKDKAFQDYQTHDGLFKVESIVPLTLSGPGIKKGAEIPHGRNIDILPTLLEALGVEYDGSKLDGEPLLEALEKVKD